MLAVEGKHHTVKRYDKDEVESVMKIVLGSTISIILGMRTARDEKLLNYWPIKTSDMYRICCYD